MRERGEGERETKFLLWTQFEITKKCMIFIYGKHYAVL